MKNPRIKTKVVHSQTKAAWNVIGTTPGGKFKIARVPYIAHSDEKLGEIERGEALVHAEFISYCFNHSDAICSLSQKSDD